MTCWISCLTKVMKVARNILPDGNQLTFEQLAALECPTHQKTNLTKLYKKISQRYLNRTRSILCILVNLSVLEKGIHDAKFVATRTELQKVPSILIQSSDSMFSDHTFPRICVCSNMRIKILHTECVFSW